MINVGGPGATVQGPSAGMGDCAAGAEGVTSELGALPAPGGDSDPDVDPGAAVDEPSLLDDADEVT